MFKIFLRKKLHSGLTSEAQTISHDRKSRQRNRRLYQRYQVNQQNLTILNDQDILVIRDLSPQGFSSDVSTRAFDRFLIDDIYEARMRYLGEVHDITVKVAWKRNKVVGFELLEAEARTLFLFQRLLRPLKIASSLSEVDAEFLREAPERKTWFHGDEGTDLIIWRGTDTRSIDAWQLIIGEDYIEWNARTGLTTGIAQNSVLQEEQLLTEPQLLLNPDEKLDQSRLRMAADLFTALRLEVKAELLASLLPVQGQAQ